MTLQSFIRKVGDQQASELFGVSERTAASWRRGERFPRTEKAHEIVKASNNEISFSECYQVEEKAA